MNLTSEPHGIRLNASIADNLISVGLEFSLIHVDNIGMALVA